MATQKEAPDVVPEEVTKQSIRLKVWDTLEKKKLAQFPLPCKNRIPNFVGAGEAANKLATLDTFKNAVSVKVNPDKPQERVRYLTLQNKKNLYVPIPRLLTGLFQQVVPPKGQNKQYLLSLASKQLGIRQFGTPIDFNANIKVDLVVLGAVAVSKEGYRIGKGEGFADLEFAIMMKMGAVSQDTIVATTVHDEQVFDTLPKHLFRPHDVPVDWIITPTKIYEIEERLPKPSGIIWHILSNRRLELIPILKTIRDKEIVEGKDCTLKEEDSDVEERPPRPPPYRLRPFRFTRQRRNTSSQNGADVESKEEQRPSRTFRRTRPRFKRNTSSNNNNNNDNKDSTTVEGGNYESKEQKTNETTNGEVRQKRPYYQQPIRRRGYKPKPPIDFSVRVTGLTAGTRVRDLKSALQEKGVKPRDITWRGFRGFAFLHFVKVENVPEKPEKPVAMDDVIASLQGLTVKSKNKDGEDNEALLTVEPAKTISRIENAGVTAV